MSQENIDRTPAAEAWFKFAYALMLYAGFSVFLMSLQFFLAAGLIYASFKTLNFALGPEGAYRVKTAVYDSLGFAFLAATNTVLQYYMASKLARELKKGQRLARHGFSTARLFAVLFFSCGVSAISFIRLSAKSSFSSYALASLPLIVSYLLGGVMGLVQKDEENPFRNSKMRIFRLD